MSEEYFMNNFAVILTTNQKKEEKKTKKTIACELLIHLKTKNRDRRPYRRLPQPIKKQTLMINHFAIMYLKQGQIVTTFPSFLLNQMVLNC